VEHVDHLGQQRDARINRNVLAAHIFRQAAAIPVFVEILNAECDRLGEMHHAGDLGAAMTACLDQFLRRGAGCLESGDQRADAIGEPGFQPGVGEHETQGLRQAAVDVFGVAFEGDVVGQIKLADARRIAAATEVLEQQRVIEFADLLLAQPDFAADVDTDPAAADAMSGRLALDQIERITERAEEFGTVDFVKWLLVWHGRKRTQPA
jgi:hypothetical protein